MKHNGEEIVYIVYHDGIPHDAITVTQKGTCTYFDLQIMNNDPKDLVYYESGMGGLKTEIRAPQYIDGCTGVTYWMAGGASFSGEPKNINRIDRPLILSTYQGKSDNPFKVSEEVYNMDYCNKCECWSRDYCRQHIYEDDEGDLRYYETDELVE